MDHEPIVTVYLRDCDQLGRVVVEKTRSDGARALADDVPVAMLPSLSAHWTTLGWNVIDDRSSRRSRSEPAPATS